MAGGHLLALAQPPGSRLHVVVVDFLRRRHRRIGEPHDVGVLLDHLFEAEGIGLFGEADRGLDAGLEVSDHDLRQAVLLLEPDEVPRERRRPDDQPPRPMRNEVAPHLLARGFDRRFDDLEVDCPVGIGEDDEAVATMIEFVSLAR